MPSWHLCQFGIIPSRHKIVYCAAMAKEPYPSETADRYIVRFPDGMRDRIREEAEKNNRSMNAEIIARLEASLSSRDFASDVSGKDLARTTRELMDIVDDLKGANRYYILGMRMILERILLDNGNVDDKTLAQIKKFVTAENLFEPRTPENK